MATAERGIWVYAVAQCGAGATLPGFAGVAGAAVRLAAACPPDTLDPPSGGPRRVREGAPRRDYSLTAVVSDVDLAEFGPAALERNLEDLAWLERVARAHHGVIDAAARLFPLLPMRLATVYTSEATMAASLREHAAAFEAALRRLRGRTEWGVKAYAVQPPRAPDRAAGPSRDSSAPAPDGGAGSGVAYLRRRRDALSARRDSWRGAAESARVAHAELGRHAADSRLHAPQSPQLSGRTEPMVLNAAYLLDDDRAGQFAEAVDALNAQHPQLRLELTGPWPPYSFAELDTGDAGDEAGTGWARQQGA